MSVATAIKERPRNINYVIAPDYVVAEPSFLGFNLAFEETHIHSKGEAYYETFRDNARFYAKEAYGKPPATPYEHEIIELPTGEVRLKFKGVDILARNNYVEGTKNKDHPLWMRERAFKDVDWVISLEEYLQHAQPGDMFIDVSPTAFEIPLEERQRFMFGNHSFFRVHQVHSENGGKKLRSTALLHYLRYDQQTALYNELTGQNLDCNEILGTIFPLRNSRIHTLDDITDLRNKIGTIYVNTPLEERLPQDIQVENDILDKHLNILQSWLDGIYELIKRRVPPEIFVKEFQAWEMAFKNRVHDNYNPEEDEVFLQLTPQDIVDKYFTEFSYKSHLSYYDNFFPVMPMIPARYYEHYTPGGGSCGMGAGYSSSFGGTDMSFFSGPMDYVTMTINNGYSGGVYYSFKEELYEDYKCPNPGKDKSGRMICGKTIKGELKNVDPSEWKKECPHCKYPLRCGKK